MKGIVYQPHILRTDIKKNPARLYVFGDNLDRQGFGGQAREMRGEPNAVGIPTKRLPTMEAGAFLTDGDFDRWYRASHMDIQRLMNHGDTIVWPLAGIGTGLAELEKRAPVIFGAIKMLERFLLLR